MHTFQENTPPLLLCLGLPGSASTWVYNVCIHLCGLRAPGLVSMGYSDEAADFLDKIAEADPASVAVVVKSHYADAGMHAFLQEHGGKCVLSIRDPRDCVVSLMERFHDSFEMALINVKAGCDAVMRFKEPGVPLLRYEDAFYQSPEILMLLKQYLAPEGEANLAEVAQHYSREAILEFIGRLGQLGSERLVIRGRDLSDTVTHWHRNHFGDGFVGKWRTRLSLDQKTRANRALSVALHVFGYASPVESAALASRPLAVPR